MATLLLGNRFRVLGELGQGTMGAVYHVADTLDGDREMALKRIQVAGAITEELRLRFKEEFRAMVRLKHPNAIDVYGYGQLDEETQYLTMELVPGQDLSDMARGESRLPLGQVYPLLIQLLQALEFIHSRLYVHRDIKAQNIRVTPDGRLKLMDFGLMVRVGTQASALAGTPGYLSPEAVTRGVITAASDLYSVGCLAYELITGKLPFEGRVLDVVRSHVKDAPRPLGEAVAGVPAALEAIVFKLLAKDPADRYQNASDVGADLAALAGLAVTRQGLEQKKSYLVASGLVGRETELASLEAELAAARLGGGRAVYLGAPAGVGKSRLLRELLLQAQLEDEMVLTGHCLETGLEPLQPLAQATLPLLAVSTPEERARHHGLLARLFPGQFADADSEAADPIEVAHLHESLAAWLRGVSERVPLVLTIEDLHWADTPTLDTLNDLIPRLDGSRILLLATFRTDETPPGSAAWFSINEGLARLLSLTPLTEVQVIQLVVAMLQRVALPDAFGRFLYAATAGNAFYITEMLRYLMEEGVLALRDGVWHLPEDLSVVELPASVEETVLRRLRQLSPEARHLATTAAVMGRYQDRTSLLAVSSMDEDTLFAALDELIERQFLVVEAHRYSFPHDRVREALYGEIDEPERRRLHQRYALLLEATQGAELALSELAYHFSQGEDMGKAFGYQQMLGDQARQDGLFTVAVKAWLQAIAHLEDLAHPDKEAKLARLRLDVGVHGFNVAPREAIAALDKAFPYFEEQAGILGDDASYVTLTQCMAAMASAYGFHGEPNVSLAMADLLATVARSEAPLQGAARAVYCAGLLPAGHFDAVLASAREAAQFLVEADLTGYPPLVYSSRVVAASYQNALAYQGFRPDEGWRDFALDAARAMKAFHLTNEVQHFFALWYAWTGREDEALALMEEMVHDARAIGAPPSPYVLYLRPFILSQRGELEDALTLVRQALRYPHLDQNMMLKRMIEVLQGSIQQLQGDLDGAEATLWPVEAHARQSGMDFVRIQALLPLGKTLLARGDRESGLSAFEVAEGLAARGPARNPLQQALALMYLGEEAIVDRAYELSQQYLNQALAIAEAPTQDNWVLQAQLKLAFATLYEAQGRYDAARQSLREAANIYHRMKNRGMLHVIQLRLEGLAEAVALPPVEAPREVSTVPAWLRDSETRFQGR